MTDFADAAVESGRDLQAVLYSSTYQLQHLTPTDQEFTIAKKQSYDNPAKVAVYTTPPVSPPGQDFRVASGRFDQAYGFTRGMDSDERYRAQYRTSAYQTEGIVGTTGQALPLESAGQSRQSLQPSIATPRSDIAVTASGQNPSVPAYGSYSYNDPSSFSASSNQTSSMSYSQEYGGSQARQSQGQPQPQQQQQYPAYATNMVYTGGQQSSTTYQAVPQYNQRQSAGVEMPNQFGTGTYYNSGEGPATAMTGIPTQYLDNQMDATAYQPQATAGRATMARPYPVSMAPYEPMLATDTMQNRPGPADPRDPGPDDAFEGFKMAMPKIFGLVKAGRVEAAGDDLLSISDWLGKAVVSLDLTKDQSDVYAERLELWRQFNDCWLTLGQKQKDLTLEMQRTGRRPSSLLTIEKIRKMGDDLSQLCDTLEPHGLVDYELGVWEEQILSIFIECRQLLGEETSDQAESTSTARPTTSQ